MTDAQQAEGRHGRVERARRRGGERMPLWLLALVGLFALQVSPLWYTTPDSVRYLSIARHIAAGSGIADLDNAAPCFPPGYPLLIAPAFLASARPFLAIAAIQSSA